MLVPMNLFVPHPVVMIGSEELFGVNGVVCCVGALRVQAWRMDGPGSKLVTGSAGSRYNRHGSCVGFTRRTPYFSFATVAGPA